MATAIGEQMEGLQQILSNRFTIITGKAGAGKSEIFKTVVTLLKDNEAFLFLAPTGKAVQAIHEKIGDMVPDKNYFTIDKFLVKAKAVTDLFEPASAKPLEDFCVEEQALIENEDKKPVNIIIDEASMIDIISMGNLCHTLSTLWGNPGKIKRFVLVGDINQLPPVESGYPFRRLLTHFEEIKPKAFGFCRLSVSLRFILGENNNLVLTKYADSFTGGQEDATKEPILELPECCGTLKKQGNTDNFYVGSFSDQETLNACIQEIFALQLNFEKVGEYYKIKWGNKGSAEESGLISISQALENNSGKLAKELETLSKEIGKEKAKVLAKNADTYFLSMVQFITPTKKSYFGVTELGVVIGDLYPQSGLHKYIQTKNDNNQGIFNGNLAVKYKKDKEYLFYPDSAQEFEAKDIVENNQAEPAYAITVHKSQGSGFSITVAILPESIHEGLKSNELQYTAVTRTKDICILLKEKPLAK